MKINYEAKKAGLQQETLKRLLNNKYLTPEDLAMSKEDLRERINQIFDVITADHQGFERYRKITDRLIIVNEDGIVKDGLTNHEFKPIIDKSPASRGIPYFRIWANGKKRNFKAHRIVFSVFCPNELHKPFIHHIDGNPLNYKATNLIGVWGLEHGGVHKVMRRGTRTFYEMYLEALTYANRGLEWPGYGNSKRKD